MVQQWPVCLGMDVAGLVEAVGEDVVRFKKGDRVVGRLVGFLHPDPRNAGFQQFSIAPAATVAHLPDSIAFTEAAVLPVAFDTSLVALCSPPGKGLNLPSPTLKDEKNASDHTIVVWGGSSSVGSMALQLAQAAGVRTVTVASKHNFDFCKRCGADEVFDYKDANVEKDVIAAVKAKGKFAGIFDAVSIDGQSKEHCQAIAQALGGGTVAIVAPGGQEPPEGVTVTMIFGMGPITHPFWDHFITEALESGRIKCYPPPYIVGKGLESLQKGIDRSRKGVSAEKIVVEM